MKLQPLVAGWGAKWRAMVEQSSMADLMQMLVAVVEGAMASWCRGRGGVSEWEVEGEGDDHCLAELLDSRTFGHHDLQYMYLGCVHVPRYLRPSVTRLGEASSEGEAQGRD